MAEVNFGLKPTIPKTDKNFLKRKEEVTTSIKTKVKQITPPTKSTEDIAELTFSANIAGEEIFLLS